MAVTVSGFVDEGGDQHIAFFHSVASKRFKNYCIAKLLDDNEAWCTEAADLEKVLLERLDRVIGNMEWTNKLSVFELQHVVPLVLDHLSIILKVRERIDSSGNKSRSFRFENMWTRHEGCRKTVQSA
ncbi:hypothetical protein REPUB_Repub01dG0168500 [Reevesia pubescens]